MPQITLADFLLQSKPTIVGWIREITGNAGVIAGSTASVTVNVVQHALSDSTWHSGTLTNAQAPQFLLTDGTRPLTGNLAVNYGVTIDGVDLSVHVTQPDVHHAQQHVLATGSALGGDHTISGGVAGYVLRATGATTAAIAQLQHGDLGGVSANQHHNQVHAIDGADHTITGSQFQIVGATAPNVLGLLTPSFDPGAAAAILRSSATGELILPIFTATTRVRTPLIDTASGGVTISPNNSVVYFPAPVAIGLGTNTPQRRIHVVDNTGAQMRLEYNASNYMDFLVDAGGSWRIAPTGDIIVDPAGDDMRPLRNYAIRLGLDTKKYLSLHVAEIIADTLVAEEVRSTIGGKIFVAPTTTLTRDLAAAEVVYSTITQRGATTTAAGAGTVGGYNTITQRGSATAGNDNTASLSVNRPSGVVEGDVMIAVVGWWVETLTPPTGWTQVGTTQTWDVSGDSIFARAYYRVAGASEPGAYAWGMSAANDIACTIAAYSNVDNAAPVSASSAQAQASASMTAPSVNAATDADMLLLLGVAGADSAGSRTVTPPAGMTELSDTTSLLWIKSYAAQQALTAAGATGSRTATISASTANAAFLISLRPSASVGGNTSVAASKPSGVTTGDVMIASVAHAGGQLTPPVGWSQVASQVATGATLAVYTRVAAGGEPSTYAWNLDSTDTLAVALSAYAGVNAVSPVDAFAVQVNGSGTAMVAPTLITTLATDRLIFAGAVAGNVRATPPAGMGEDADAGATGIGVYVASQALAVTGATGSRTATLASAAASATVLLALRPASTPSGPVPTTIYVKHNNLSSGDRVLLEARLTVEFMAVTSTYTLISSNPPEYSYTVQRDLDGTGANTWIAGDGVVNTGVAGNGWIELYARYGFPRAGQTATQRVGPTIVGNVRKSATFNDFREHWAVGNLNGLYDYSSSVYGAAFGDPTQTWLSLDDRTAALGGGLRFMNNLAEVGYIRNNGTWRFNGDANNYIQWDGSALRVRGDIVVQGAPGWGNVAGGVNLVRNSSFELDSNGDGLADGFGIYNNDGGAVPTTASRVAGGKSTWAQRISWTGTNASTKGILFDVTSPKRANTDYVLSFWARTNTPVALGFYENPPSSTGTNLFWPTANTTWQFYAMRVNWSSTPAANFYLSIENGAPIANGWIEFDNVQVVEGSEIVSYTSSPVDIVGFGGNINMPLAVSGAGLYMSASNLGYWNGSAWTAYMNNAGHFGLNSGGANYLVWDGATLTIAGSINIVGGNAATQTYAAGQAATAQSNAAGYTNTVASGKADTNLANSVLSTLISGANIRVGSGVKDSNLNGWNIDSGEIVGQAAGVDQVVLDGTGRIIAGGSMVKIDGNGIDIVRGAGSQVNRLNFVTSLGGEVAARISCYTDSSAILPYYNHNVLILAPLATAGKAGRLTLVQSDLWVDGSLGAWNNLSFGSGWTNYGSGYQTCQYRRFGDRVHLRGLASNTSTGATIGTLPVGYRPTAGRLILNLQAYPSGAMLEGGYRVDIDTSGNILAVGWTPANGDWVSLNCSFSIS